MTASTVVGIMALHTALYHDTALVLLVSPTLRQSGELFKKCVSTYRALGRPVPAEAEAESASSLTFENGSRIVSLPGKKATVRGYSGASLIAIDEASRVPNDLYLGMRPMLAVSGVRLIAPSTPHGSRGWWYESWRGPEPWQRFEVPATDCPRIADAFLAEERRTIGAFWYEQEYLCRFLAAESAAFRREDIERAFDREIDTWNL